MFTKMRRGLILHDMNSIEIILIKEFLGMFVVVKEANDESYRSFMES